MTTAEKRAAILEIAEPTLVHLKEIRMLQLLRDGSDGLIEDAWTRFFEVAWIARQQTPVDKQADTA